MNATQLAASYYGKRNVARYITRRNDVLAQLEMLADADARAPFQVGPVSARRHDRTSKDQPVQHAPVDSTNKPESTTPRGVRELWKLVAENHDRPPAKDRSLFDHHLWRFEHEVGANIEYGHRLCAEAEHDYLSRVRKRVVLEDTVDRDRRILSAYRGKSPAHVSAFEHVDELHVMRLRKANELNPQTGLDPLRDEPPANDPLLSQDISLGSVVLAKEFLTIMLDDGPQPASVLFDVGARAHISTNTLKRAKAQLGVKSHKNGAGWVWALPKGPNGAQRVARTPGMAESLASGSCAPDGSGASPTTGA